MREFMIGAASAVLAITIFITREASKRPAYRQES